jgi:hypothetical protein
LFLLIAPAQSGKTTTANLIKKHIEEENKNHKVFIIPYAKYLKYIAKEYFDIDSRIKTPEVRSFLQVLGTDTIRQELNMPDFHVDRIIQDIQILENAYEKQGIDITIIIDDVRFLNEVHIPIVLFSEVARTIRINRLNFKSPLTKEQQQHKSETELLDYKCDYEITSDNGIDKLESEILRLLMKFGY